MFWCELRSIKIQRTSNIELQGAERVHIIYPPSEMDGEGQAEGLGREMGCMRKMADALWEGCTVDDWTECTHTDTHTHTHRQIDTQK